MPITNISQKHPQLRTAIAEGSILLSAHTMHLILDKQIPKGDPLQIAEAAALLAIKQTPYLIPHCHPIPIHGAEVFFRLSDSTLTCSVKVISFGVTGIEIEAITGVSIALCTIWDCVKYLEKNEHGEYPNTMIQSIKVIQKEKKDV
ncbi:MAG TPA: cyclic pyranopterin monophosphate synthase MoaC [Caldisericia bacterium]|nr:cyclic pyranopterin monophosphate synthase MoaC [Caldisericia bacterium]